MQAFKAKFLNKAVDIANELDRKNFMFEHGLTDAASLADMDANNARVMYRGYRQRKEEFKRRYKLNLYACYLGIDISHNFYKNINVYKKLPYKVRKGENLVARLTHNKTTTEFQ